MKNKDIVVIAVQPWDVEIGSNCKDIAQTFAKDNRVLYVNPPLDRKSSMLKKDKPEVQKRLRIIKHEEEGLVKINDNMWTLYPDKITESINWLPGNFIFGILNKRNNKILAACVLKAIKELGFKDIVIFNDSSMFQGFHLKELLKPKAYMYYVRDNLLITPYWGKHGRYFEPKLIAKADVITANSDYLKDYAKKYNPKAYMAGQGCDVSMYVKDDYPIPEDTKQIKYPVIGYLGFLTAMRLDIDLLVGIAEKKPEWQIVLVGPEDEEFQKSKLHQLKNVHFLGSKTPDEVPSYINTFDVCMNPQAINELTIGNYPRKIDEYLAMGKPTVATQTIAMDYFKDFVLLGTGVDEYITLIEQGLQQNSDEIKKARRKYASAHNWEASTELIYKAFEKVLKN